ncbi:RXLR effector family protein, putative [Phytophthora infestans T30-4]|uniref:RXLR effector family protein, putative n=1 Tax=Phytophthora infestans (strain T30-4) TaxID=403677 RepID=D0NP15_PHYIT|nr:RXLR effector family protein, putative [Phytophthora infestans T30-4]EEY62357.1 RXLR effector family protein, putative [Phytophthora infestans T30-4]|eukprot:XP_002898993.1 RXLR effector family protein, putative [Phytophthora infestans T30-4]
MLKADEALGSAFKTLKLSTMRIGKDDTKMVAKFLSSRNFKIWFQHAVKINKDDPYGEMLKALTNVFGEKNVAMMILAGNLSRNSRDVAKKLEKAQFYKWYFVDKYKTADEVFTNVLKADRNRIHGYGREKEI